jgi:Flp pilus assembly protein TadD
MTEEYDPTRVGLLLAAGRYDDVIAAAARQLGSNPDDATAAQLIARAHLGAGRQPEALDAALRAMALDPMDVVTQEVRALALHNMRRDDQADPVARWVVAQRPESWSSWRLLALVSADPNVALNAARRALELEPAEPQAHVALGHVLLRASRVDEAAAAFRRALALSPTDAAAQNGLGLVALRSGRAAEAATGFRDALVHDPTQTAARGNLRVALLLAIRPIAVTVWVAAIALRLVTDSSLSTMVCRLAAVAAGLAATGAVLYAAVRFVRPLAPSLRGFYGRLVREDTRLLWGTTCYAIAVLAIWAVAVLPRAADTACWALALVATVAGRVLIFRGTRRRRSPRRT